MKEINYKHLKNGYFKITYHGNDWVIYKINKKGMGKKIAECNRGEHVNFYNFESIDWNQSLLKHVYKLTKEEVFLELL